MISGFSALNKIYIQKPNKLSSLILDSKQSSRISNYFPNTSNIFVVRLVLK